MSKDTKTKRKVRTGGRRKLSLSEENSIVLSVRVPRSWVKALRKLETEEVKQQMLVRRALRQFLEMNGALPPAPRVETPQTELPPPAPPAPTEAT